MTDLHTHILPGMDDGASEPAVSLGMLRLEALQGVNRVALTPHFYGNEERTGQFLARRSAAWNRLSGYLEACAKEEQSALPELVLGAEVAWMPNMSHWDELEGLQLGNSGFFLLELPFYPWSGSLIDQLYDLLGRVRIVPVLAHIERYFGMQRTEYLREVLSMGVPLQFSADRLLRLRGRRALLRLLRQGENCTLASDCHNLTDRKPNLGPAVSAAEKSLDERELKRLLTWSDQLFTPQRSRTEGAV